jgi:hypothetical protein
MFCRQILAKDTYGGLHYGGCRVSGLDATDSTATDSIATDSTATDSIATDWTEIFCQKRRLFKKEKEKEEWPLWIVKTIGFARDLSSACRPTSVCQSVSACLCACTCKSSVDSQLCKVNSFANSKGSLLDSTLNMLR